MQDATVTVLGKLENWPHAVHVTKTGGARGEEVRHYALSETFPELVLQNPMVRLCLALGYDVVPEGAKVETVIFTIDGETLMPTNIDWDIAQSYNAHWNNRTTEDQLDEVYANDAL